MFTGLVKETGKVTEIKETGEGKRITISADKIPKDVSQGDSINVSGACLTVEKHTENSLTFFLAEETLEKTWFNQLKEKHLLNLEPALKAEDRMGGHQVQGHTETTSKILSIEELEKGWNIKFQLPSEIKHYVIEKGFITVDGISLTTNNITQNTFSATIIPETWNITNLSEKEVEDNVNLETDPIGRYIEKIVQNQLDV